MTPTRNDKRLLRLLAEPNACLIFCDSPAATCWVPVIEIPSGRNASYRGLRKSTFWKLLKAGWIGVSRPHPNVCATPEDRVYGITERGRAALEEQPHLQLSRASG